MRRYKKFNSFLKNNSLYFCPNRILNFKRPKWEFLNKKISQVHLKPKVLFDYKINESFSSNHNFFNFLKVKSNFEKKRFI